MVKHAILFMETKLKPIHGTNQY